MIYMNTWNLKIKPLKVILLSIVGAPSDRIRNESKTVKMQVLVAKVGESERSTMLSRG